MKRLGLMAAVLLMLFAAPAASDARPDADVLYQTSTLEALLVGIYDGKTTFGELRQHGDFGIGTFNAVDGEMVGLDGRFYQVLSSGRVHVVPDWAKTPFAAVTFFEPDTSVPLGAIDSFTDLESKIDSVIPTQNIFYAIKITGDFTYIKTRSAPKQSKPYKPLAQALKNQPTFEFHNVKGTIVGLRCPDYVKGINVPGYHFHFITNDRTAGGHLLECKFVDNSAQIDYTSEFFLALPDTREFDSAQLGVDRQAEIKQVEK